MSLPLDISDYNSPSNLDIHQSQSIDCHVLLFQNFFKIRQFKRKLVRKNIEHKLLFCDEETFLKSLQVQNLLFLQSLSHC